MSSATTAAAAAAATSAVSSAFTLTLPPLYAWVLFDVALIGLQIWLTGFAAGSQRRKFFPKSFFEKNFPQLLKSKYKVVGGYPDGGMGRFADKLSDEDWIVFNNYQRAHYNYIEGATTIVVSLLIAGLYFTRTTALAGLAYIVGRQLYAIGYYYKGASGRMLGILLVDLSLIYAIGAAIYGSFTLAGGIDGARVLLGF